MARLQDAFDSLSDVFIEELDGIHKSMQEHNSSLQNRVTAIENSLSQLQDQVARVDGKRRQLHDSVDRRFDNAQDNFSKFALNLYETQSDLHNLKNSSEQILSREREAAHLLQSLQSSHDQVTEWVQKLRQDCGNLQTELYTFKEEMGGTCVAVASDVQAIAKECTAVRSLTSQSNGQLLGKLETLREATDRQSKMDRNQLHQRLDVLGENLATHELRSKDAFTTLLKNHSRIRVALDEGMGICSSEIKTLAHEVKGGQSEQQSKMDAVVEQLTNYSTEWVRKHDDLESAIRAITL